MFNNIAQDLFTVIFYDLAWRSLRIGSQIGAIGLTPGNCSALAFYTTFARFGCLLFTYRFMSTSPSFNMHVKNNNT